MEEEILFESRRDMFRPALFRRNAGLNSLYRRTSDENIDQVVTEILIRWGGHKFKRDLKSRLKIKQLIQTVTLHSNIKSIRFSFCTNRSESSLGLPKPAPNKDGIVSFQIKFFLL